MNIKQMIEEMCPNGVEWKKLGNVTIWDKKFNGTDKEIQPNTVKFIHISAADLKKIKLINNGDIKLLATGKYDGLTTEENCSPEIINSGEVITIPSGGNANIKYYNGKFVDSGNIIAISSDISLYSLKYIYYYLESINKKIQSKFNGGVIKHPRMNEIINIEIPIPPIEIQNEIVRILDNFTALENELENELELRKKQYDYYRNKLLDFSGEREQLVTYFEIKDISKIIVGGDVPKNEHFSKFKTELHNIPIISNGIDANSIQGYTDKIRLNNETITISGRGTIGHVQLFEEKIFPVVRLLCLTDIKNNILIKYLKYFLQTIKFKPTLGGIPQLTGDMIKNINIPIPSLEEQQRIVNILDKFEKLTNDISEGLPYLISLERKRYEYYRKKLLSF